ncbi:MAG: hypothetical protein HGB08_04545 [Candidatus Moranbacteria bacterium]|nr:hypothetical protein [Candidatus Moranbacteria bacterium]
MKADIFFFISSIASIVLTLLLSLALFYFIKAGRNLYIITEKLHEHFKDSEEFVLDLRERLERNLLFRMFFPSMKPRRREKKTRKRNDEE